MSETPEERLARLRREVEAVGTPPREALDTGPPPSRAADPGPPPRAADPGPPPVPVLAATPPPGHSPEPPPPSARPPRPPVAASPSPRGPASHPSDATTRADDGWSIADALGGASLGQWVGVGLLVVGGYLVASWFVPGIGFPGSVAMAATGLVLLWQHFGHRAGPWALYAGMVLAYIGGLRVLADLLPFDVHGETSLGLGLALLTVAWLRHTQAGGWGWQGVAGAAALAWGLLQLVLGLLPGSPGLLDLVLPVLLLAGGGWLLLRTARDRA